jgi:uncharacterized membrane protein required for colicin V production
MLDNLLGLGFGALRGAFIVSLGYLVLSLVVDEENPPEWIKGAQTRPFAQKGALMLAAIAPGYLEEISSMSEKMKAEKEGEDQPVEDSQGYSGQQRQMLENIMNSSDISEQ